MGLELQGSRRLWPARIIGVAALALVPFSFHADRRFETAERLEGTEAHFVAEQLASRFRSPFVDRLVLVIRGLPPADTGEGAEALNRISESLQSLVGSVVVSYVDLPDPLFLGSDGGTFVMIGPGASSGPVEELVPKFRERAAALQRQLRAQYPNATLELTGETPLNFDLRKASSDDVRHGEILVLPVTLGLLVLAFGSLAAAVTPVVAGQLAISATLGIAALLARHWHMSILVQNVAAMVGLGLGIDYALLMVSRFRESLAAGHAPVEAARRAAHRAGMTLLISAMTVVIGFAALLTVPVNEVRSIGVAGLIVTGVSIALATMLVPAGLAVLGKRIDSGAIPLVGRRGSPAESRGRWVKWGDLVTAHPWIALLLAGSPLLMLGWQAFRLNTELPRGDWLPSGSESVEAFRSLMKMGRGGVIQSLRVLIELPSDSIAESEAAWGAIKRASDRLGADSRTDRVISVLTLTEGERANLESLPPELVRTFLSTDGRAGLLEVLPGASLSSEDQVHWVRELRRSSAAELTGVAGAKLFVGGVPALNADYESSVLNRLGSVIALVVGGTLVALVAGFRSIVAAVKAIALNLLSVGAGFGALVLVFQEGHGSRLFGIQDATHGVFPIVPILTFAIVFGLSMDYEVFLVARVLEARRSGLSERGAISEGLARTAGLITSAAAIMIVVFAGFTLGDFLVIKMLGFTLAVAVLIDATLVRIVIGPALLSLAGDWNWWPWGLSTSGPRID